MITPVFPNSGRIMYSLMLIGGAPSIIPACRLMRRMKLKELMKKTAKRPVNPPTTA